MCSLQSPACAGDLSGLLPSTLSFTKLTLHPSGLSLGVILLCKAFQNPPRWVESLTSQISVLSYEYIHHSIYHSICLPFCLILKPQMLPVSHLSHSVNHGAQMI